MATSKLSYVLELATPRITMTAATLRNHSYKELVQLARSKKVPGWHAMRKDELIQALVRQSKRKAKSPAATHNATRSTNGSSTRQRSRKVEQQLTELRANLATSRQIATSSPANGESGEDRLVVMVRDPYWLQAYWEINPRSVRRAQSALGQSWHATRPVLRVFEIASDGTSVLYREVAIHGGVNHWYVDVQNPPQEYRMELGYVAPSGRFYCLARSNAVTTPPAGTSDSVDENWVDIDENADRIFAMSGGYSPRGASLELQELLEERLRRPMGSPMQTRYGGGAARMPGADHELEFAVDAELVVYGVSDPHAHVTLQGEPVTLRSDGSFAVRMQLPDRRQVIPVVASSPDGIEQRTIILAVERNTKLLGPVMRDAGS